MLVTVTCSITDAVYSLEVSPDMELENFRVLVGVESGQMDRNDSVFFHSGKLLVGDKKSLSELGVADNDVLLFGSLPQGSHPFGGLMQSPSPSHRPRLTQDTSRTQTPTSSSGKYIFVSLNACTHAHTLAHACIHAHAHEHVRC